MLDTGLLGMVTNPKLQRAKLAITVTTAKQQF